EWVCHDGRGQASRLPETGGCRGSPGSSASAGGGGRGPGADRDRGDGVPVSGWCGLAGGPVAGGRGGGGRWRGVADARVVGWGGVPEAPWLGCGVLGRLGHGS